jgi:hypothetical protein
MEARSKVEVLKRTVMMSVRDRRLMEVSANWAMRHSKLHPQLESFLSCGRKLEYTLIIIPLSCSVVGPHFHPCWKSSSAVTHLTEKSKK